MDEGQSDLGLDALELHLHLAAQLQIQGPERLIEQQDLGPVDQRPRQGNPLLLPPGELGRLAAGQVRELHEFEGFVGERQGILHTPALGPEGDIVTDRQMGEEGIGLKDGVDRTFIRP